MDADVITDAAPETDEWFAARRMGITATDVVKILGLSKYGNALGVYHDKRGELEPDKGGPAAEWGHLLEDVVAQKWAADNGFTVARVGVLANRDQPWQLAALDRLVDGCGDCWLEVKCRSAFKAGAFRDDVPDDVLAQVAWQRMVTGLDHGHVAVLIGGNDLREFRYDRDPDVEAYVLDEARAVWQCVQDGTPPQVDSTDALLDILNRLYPDRAGATEVDPDEYARLKADYDRAAATAKTAEGGKAWAAYQLIALIGAGHTAVDREGNVLATYKPTMRARATNELLDALREYPEAHKIAARKFPTKPSLNWK